MNRQRRADCYAGSESSLPENLAALAGLLLTVSALAGWLDGVAAWVFGG